MKLQVEEVQSITMTTQNRNFSSRKQQLQ
jgi:hypothetical protein